MRRLICLLIVLILITCQGIAFPEGSQCGIKAYRFDLKMSLNTDAFPEKERGMLKGYADLLDSLRFRGELYLSDGLQFDLRLSVIPNGNEGAAIQFRIYGAEIASNIASPLFGSSKEMEFLNTALVEFALKIYNHLSIPLHWACFFFPFVRNQVLAPFVETWKEVIGTEETSGLIPAEKWERLAEKWKQFIDTGWYFGQFVTALGIVSGKEELLRQVFASIPDTLVKAFGDGVDRQNENGKEVWRYGDKTLFERTAAQDSESWRLTPPPLLDGRISVSASADHRNAEKGKDHSILFQMADKEIGDLIDFSLDAEAVPDMFPSDSDFSVRLKLSGLLVPRISAKVSCRMTKDGEVCLSLDWEPGETTEKKAIFTVQGTFSPFDADTDHSFGPDSSIVARWGIFFLNDYRLSEFVREVLESFVRGIIPFAVELPVSACQSIMDTLTETGIIDAVIEK